MVRASKTRSVLLVRHCQSAGQQPNAGLTEAGVRQAERLADFLADYAVDLIVASRYARARQSIEPYAGGVGLPIHQDARLNERTLSAWPIADWEQFVRRSFDDPDLCAPGGESASQVLCRAQAGLKDILESEYESPLVVTHGNLMALLLHSVDATFGYAGMAAPYEPGRLPVERRPRREPVVSKGVATLRGFGAGGVATCWVGLRVRPGCRALSLVEPDGAAPAPAYPSSRRSRRRSPGREASR